MRVDVQVNYKQAQKGLTELQLDQYPYALSHSLTKTAQGAQRAVRRSTDRKFDLHSKFVKTNIRITPALKSDIIRFNLAVAEVRTDKKISRFMVQHEPGATRRPLRSKTIAIPGPGLKKEPEGFRGRSGKVKAKFSPKALLKGRRTKAQKDGGTGKAFLINSKSGDGLIVRRVGKARRPLELLYILKKNVNIKKTWRFARVVRKYAEARFLGHFKRGMKKAMATRRR